MVIPLVGYLPCMPGTPPPMNRIQRALRAADALQRRGAVLGFLYGVMKKYGDDRAGQLAALLTYYGFLTIFPLLLLFVTIVGMVAGSDPSLAHRIEHSVFSQFPVIGSGSSAHGLTLANSIHALHKNSAIGLAVGIVGLLWGSQGASQTGQFAMAQVWNIPGVERPSYWARFARTWILTAMLGVFVILSFALAGVASWGQHGLAIRVGGIAGSLVVNGLAYVVMFRVLTPKHVGTRRLVPGALAGAAFWTVLQNVGTELVEHQLRGSSQVYGAFAVVLGLIAWIYLAMNMTMYAAEANVVLTRRLWPRSLVQPPLTDADQAVLAAIAKQETRRPEQRVEVAFAPDPPDRDQVPTEDPIPTG
jgi:YihY family inner membrane protein